MAAQPPATVFGVEIVERLNAIKREMTDIYRSHFDPVKTEALAQSISERLKSFARHPLFSDSGGSISQFIESVTALAHSAPPSREDAFWQSLNSFADLCRPALQSDIQFLPGIGPARAEQFRKKNIHTIQDMLLTPPRDYHDRRFLVVPSEEHLGKTVNLYARIKLMKAVRARFVRRRSPSANRLELWIECLAADSSSSPNSSSAAEGDLFAAPLPQPSAPGLTAVFFGQTYLEKLFKLGDKVFFSGKLENFRGRLQLINPEFEIEHDPPEESHTRASDVDLPKIGIVPVYSLTEGLGHRSYRRLVARAIRDYAELCLETLPRHIRESQLLPPIRESIRHLHFPDIPESAGLARRRFKFEELFLYQLVILTLREEVRKIKKDRAYSGQEMEERFLTSFRGQLTRAQSRAWSEIRADLDRPSVMNRLLFGDVGSGKTLVAELACLHVVASGYQAAILAPTEVLAEQHHATLMRDLSPIGARVGFLKGSLPAAKKREIKAGLSSGEIQIAVGTHALLQEDVTFRQPALFVIDEQHRFGVLQRAALREKGPGVDLLIMSATPIPRTLQMTLFGDLDMSFLDERPPGAPPPPMTRLLKDTAEDRAVAKKIIQEALREKQKVYVIYPLIEESETLDLRAATVQKNKIEQVFPKACVGLLHGRMAADEKEEMFRNFRDGDMDILVSTTVIEVGLDVSRANLIVIEHAERFGLSQLHQLRGRVGRHERQGLCVAIHHPEPAPETAERLRVFAQIDDGAKLAEEDLRLRGGGELFGTRQWGLPDFRFAEVYRDVEILKLARQAAEELLKNDPHLLKHEHHILRQTLIDRYQGRLPLAKVS